MCEGTATTATATDAASSLFTVAADGNVNETTTTFNGDVRQEPQQPPLHHHENHHLTRTGTSSSSTHNDAWDVIPPLMSLQQSPNSNHNNTDLMIWKETTLQYQRTLQHMGTCIVPNDIESSLVASSTTTTTNTATNPGIMSNDTHPLKSSPSSTKMTTASISTNPSFITLSTSTAAATATATTNDGISTSGNDNIEISYMIVGCHDGTICLWNLHHLPAIQQQYYYDMESIRHNTMNENTPETVTTTTTTSMMDPIHVVDTLSPIQPCYILDTTKHTTTNSFPHNTGSSSMKGGHHPPNTTTTTTIITNSLSTITHIFPISNNKLVVMNVVGMIYIVQMTTVPNSNSNRGGSMDHGTTSGTVTIEPMMMIIQQMWSTGRIHPTSGYCSVNLDYIFIGYQSGYVECWSIPSSSSLSIPIDTTINPTKDHATVLLESSPTLRWRGNFANDHSSPPPSIASIVPLNQQQQQHSEHECLVISLHNDGHQRPNTSAMVEVVDATSIMIAWNEGQSSTNQNNSDRSLPLEDFIVLPEAGREILNIFPTNQERSSSRTLNHWIQSRGTNSLLSTSAMTATSSNRTDDTDAIALGHADGMVTILDVTPTVEEQHTTTPSWGVSANHSRYCSPYPCIGIGRIDLSDSKNGNNNDKIITQPQPYLACCLRGAATYLIPLQSASRHDDATVFALSVPHDMNEDVSIRYTQGFAAGNIPLNNRNDTTILSANGSSLPLLAYVWPGGVIDVFSCGLLPHVSASSDVQLLKELIANGSVDALRELILSFDDDNDDVMMKWTNALQEIRRHGETTPIRINDILSDNFISLRTELLNINQ